MLNFSLFTGWLHKEPNLETDFVTISTEFNHSISLTPDHLIYIVDCETGSRKSVTSAGKVEIGEQFRTLLNFVLYSLLIGFCLNVFNGSWFNPRQVMGISTSRKIGVYAPVTESGSLVVNNIAVSCFSAIENEQLQFIVFRFLTRLKYFLHAIYRMCDSFSFGRWLIPKSTVENDVLIFLDLSKFFVAKFDEKLYS